MEKLLPRLLGVIGVHAAAGAAAWALGRWALVRQDGLSGDVLARIDGDPGRAAAYLSDVGGEILNLTAGSVLLSAVLACAWLVMIHRDPPYGDKSARARRGSWALLLLVAVVGSLGLFWLRLIGAPLADLLAPGVPVEAALIGLGAVLIAYWISTAAFAPTSTKVAVPGGTLLAR